MACNDGVCLIDKDRVGPAELFDAGGNLRYLLIAMRAAVTCIRRDLSRAAIFDVDIGHKITGKEKGQRLQEHQHTDPIH